MGKCDHEEIGGHILYGYAEEINNITEWLPDALHTYLSSELQNTLDFLRFSFLTLLTYPADIQACYVTTMQGSEV